MNTIQALSHLKDRGYIRVTAPMVAKVIEEEYESLVKHIFEHGNTTQIKSILFLVNDISKFPALRNYVMVYFPVMVSKQSVSLTIRGEKRANAWSSSNNWFSQENLISYDEFKSIRSALREVYAQELKTILDAFRKIAGSKWRDRFSKALIWPSTYAPPSVRDIFLNAIMPTGILSLEGYHVGQESEAPRVRRARLGAVLQKPLDEYTEILEEEYLEEWGGPYSIERLMKTARVIAALCRNAKRSPYDYSKAVSEWEADLEFLRETYFDPLWAARVVVVWPSTSALHDE